MKNMSAVKKINDFKLNPDLDLNLELENENYSRYGKVKIFKLNKFYGKQEKFKPWLF